MIISLNWLKHYVEINETKEDLAHALTMIGQEVEAIELKDKYLKNVFVGQITKLEKLPKSDHLTHCQVDIGKTTLNIVCGAPNHKEGDKVAAAVEGAVINGGLEIKNTQLMGKLSQGMLCSEKELGLSDYHDGIIILPKDAPLGTEIKEYLQIDDIAFELEITPNRPDCLSHIGIAREIAAYYGRKLKYPDFKLNESDVKTRNHISVEIKSKDLCKRYAARIVKDVKIRKSPDWLRKSLNAIGIRSINNVVDISNFVMMEYGHPLHTFDYDRLNGNKIIVRRAEKDEKFITLDDIERTLDEETLLITDAEKPIALAGVMGGANTEVSENTTNILIEVAQFDRITTRKTSRKLGLISDSSYRFERGIDIEDTEKVINRAAYLIQQVAGGEILEGIVEEYVEKPEIKPVEINTDKLNSFLGKDVPQNRVVEILENLEMKVKKIDETNFEITPPSFRPDVEQPSDLYEEILRMYGFVNIPYEVPKEVIKPGFVSKDIFYTSEFKKLLSYLGLHEVINYSFISEDFIAKLDLKNEKNDYCFINNPINEDMVIMRPTLIHSLLNNIRYNLNRNNTNINIFEISRIYNEIGEVLPQEKEKICIALAGQKEKDVWHNNAESYDFFDLKGIIELLLEKSGIDNYSFTRSSNPVFHPGRSADLLINNECIGVFGEIHPNILENYDIKERSYISELDLEGLIKHIKLSSEFSALSKYPAVERDLAIVIDDEILLGDMLNEVRKTSDLIEKIVLFDIYRDEKIGKNKKSCAFNIIFRHPQRTLKDSEIDEIMSRILKSISKNYSGELRT